MQFPSDNQSSQKTTRPVVVAQHTVPQIHTHPQRKNTGTEDAIRRRVRDVVAACQPGGGFCLGSGNTVANYIPLDNYLAMLDEGRRHG